jgi:hypothetical protein
MGKHLLSFYRSVPFLTGAASLLPVESPSPEGNKNATSNPTDRNNRPLYRSNPGSLQHAEYF